MRIDLRNRLVWTLAFGVLVLSGCKLLEDEAKDAKETVEETISSEVSGGVTDNRGQGVAGVTVRLYDLLDNTDFVEGSDITELEAYIDREAVLASDNDVASALTEADGSFTFEVRASAFLAVATKDGCSASFAGFDEETGVLNLDTLITPRFEDGIGFSIPTFVVACAEPPEVGPDGNSEEAPPFEPEPPAPPTCDAEMCGAAGGHCEAEACVITCPAETCTLSGGSCVEGECIVPPACDATACAAAGGTCEGEACVVPTCDASMCAAARGSCSADGSQCDVPSCFASEDDCTAAGGLCSEDGTTCRLPACDSDEDCNTAQPGAWCSEPGDVELAKCEPPAPGEITPPVEALGWTELRITDAEGQLLADASAEDARIEDAQIPEDGVVRVYGMYSGSATDAFVQVQSGGQKCARLPPRTDFIEATLGDDGALQSSDGDYVELVLHGGCQKIQLSTSEALGEGERSHIVDIGDRCAPPRSAFIAILTWNAGRRRPADLDLNVWNAAGELVFVGRKQTRWGRLRRHGRGPGPEVFIADDASEGPFTVKVQFFSGRPRIVTGKLRVFRTVDGRFRDETFRFTLNRPKDVAEIGVFSTD